MIDGISQKMLTTTLRSLERDGFVTRTVFPTTPPSVAYELTELGRDLLVPVVALAEWARKNQPRMDEARRAFDARAARETPQRAAARRRCRSSRTDVAWHACAASRCGLQPPGVAARSRSAFAGSGARPTSSCRARRLADLCERPLRHALRFSRRRLLAGAAAGEWRRPHLRGDDATITSSPSTTPTTTRRPR